MSIDTFPPLQRSAQRQLKHFCIPCDGVSEVPKAGLARELRIRQGRK
jgi:hypothetical protein